MRNQTALLVVVAITCICDVQASLEQCLPSLWENKQCENNAVTSPSAFPFLPGAAGLHLLHADRSPPADPPRDAWTRHVIRLKSYTSLSQAHSIVSALLTNHGRWALAQRAPLASLHPTDFAVISATPSAFPELQDVLLSSPLVRDVHPDRTFRRPHAATDAPAPPEGPSHASSTVDGTLTKHPGRLNTRWSSEPSTTEDEQAARGLQADAAILQHRFRAHSNAAAREGSSEDVSFRSPDSSGEDVMREDRGAYPSRHLEAWGSLLLEGMEGEVGFEESARRRMQAANTQVTEALGAQELWKEGYLGENIRVGVFDTGIREGHPHIKNLRERSNWTHENTLADELGHGTFVAGVIGGESDECPGFASKVALHTFKVFTNDQVSFTSWFLDAFNYAMATGMHIVNLSIGGPDFMDRPFVDKVLEVTSSGIIMVSAIGNDGPLYGTLNNPADQLDVIGVGGLDYSDHIAGFSSRGMSTWELPTGFGGSKPDIMAYGKDVKGSKIGGGCRSLSGTSVASPVVTGAVTLLASTVPESKRSAVLNPASMKQALVEGADRLPGLTIFEQGAGKLNLQASKAVLASYQPRASIVPPALDLTNCPYMWPYCLQSLYATGQPIIFNATVLNGMGVWGEFLEAPRWYPSDVGGEYLDVIFTYSDVLWPWSGHVSLFLSVKDAAANFRGPATGTVIFTIASPPARGEKTGRTSTVEFKVNGNIVPTPPSKSRVLWDQFHSIKYPPAYLPRDNLDIRSDILDWHGDHMLTNFHGMYTFLRESSVYVETLASPFTCFNASNYGALIMADSEEEYYPDEIAKLAQDVSEHGLGLLLFPEWYSRPAMHKMRFFDDNTRSWWMPATGGSNIPAINDLVAPYGLAFGEGVLQGPISISSAHKFSFASGTFLARAPAGTRTLSAALQDRGAPTGTNAAGPSVERPVLGMLQHGAGRLAVYGDASCLDSNHATSCCHPLLLDMFRWVIGQEQPSWFGALNEQEAALVTPDADIPERPSPDLLAEVSYVLNNAIQCQLNSATGFQRSLLTMVHKDAASGTRSRTDGIAASERASEVAQQGQMAQPRERPPADSAESKGGEEWGLLITLLVVLLLLGAGMLLLWLWRRNASLRDMKSPREPFMASGTQGVVTKSSARVVQHRPVRV